MVPLALLSLLLVLWLIWTKMASGPSGDAPQGLEADLPGPDQLHGLGALAVPSNTSSPQPLEAAGAQLPPVGPAPAPAAPFPPPAASPKQPDHPACPCKPPIPPPAPDSGVPPQGDSPRPLRRGALASSDPLLRPTRSWSLEEAEASQAQRKRQAMAKFVLGSFEDNSSDDEFLAGSLRAAGRRRSSLASVDLPSLLEAGPTATMRCERGGAGGGLPTLLQGKWVESRGCPLLSMSRTWSRAQPDRSLEEDLGESCC